MLISGGGRWSYLLRKPDAVLTVPPDDQRDPFVLLADLIGPRRDIDPAGPPFQGGVVGLASYELGDRVERLGLARSDWPDLVCARYPALLAFDHVGRWVVAVGRGENQRAAQQRAAGALTWLKTPARERFDDRLCTDLVADRPERYEAAVGAVVARIEAGELFQANIARSWTGRLVSGAAPFDLLARLATSPAPFAAYLRLGDRALVSNSPERFVQVASDGAINTRPIKGTRPRGADAAQDQGLAAELLSSDKDRAENLMIVDLMRNDLARVSPAGSVRVPELFRVETYSNVHHLVSTVTATLRPGLTAADLLKASFPPGSITGAPKVQAMSVIANLETPRGPYCGSLFWAGVDGAFESSVLIRTVAFTRDDKGWRWEARAGAGIVAQSAPRAERLETEAKIGTLLNALTGTGRPSNHASLLASIANVDP
nr:anthranilate synthase component I family protein [Caulobacter sp. AP07]